VAAGGGMTGVAAGVANTHPRHSAADPFRDDIYAARTPDFEAQSYYSQGSSHYQRSQAPPMGAAGFYDAGLPRGRSPFQGDGYDHDFDPRSIADDGDDGVEGYRSQRKSRFGRPAAAAAAGAGAAGAAGVLSARDASGHYGPVPGGQPGGSAEKSEWLQKQSGGSKKMKWIIGIIIVLVIIGAVVGIVVGVLLSRNSGGGGDGSGGSGSSAPSVDKIDGYLDLKSPQVQAVMNNKDLHKVFPAMDYSPLKTQYPDCIGDPPDQNNITLDIAVLSQLTPAVRLYGTDCNQTEMVLEAIKRLEMEDSMHIWLGVYLDGNSTTNKRQLSQMWDIIDEYVSTLDLHSLFSANSSIYRMPPTSQA